MQSVQYGAIANKLGQVWKSIGANMPERPIGEALAAAWRGSPDAPTTRLLCVVLLVLVVLVSLAVLRARSATVTLMPSAPSVGRARTLRIVRSSAVAQALLVALIDGFLDVGSIRCTVTTEGRKCNPVGSLALLQWYTTWSTLLLIGFCAGRLLLPEAGARSLAFRLVWEAATFSSIITTIGGYAMTLHGAAYVTDAEDPRRTWRSFGLSLYCLLAHTANVVGVALECRAADALPIRSLREGGALPGLLTVVPYVVYEWGVHWRTGRSHYFYVDLARPNMPAMLVALQLLVLAGYEVAARATRRPRDGAAKRD